MPAIVEKHAANADLFVSGIGGHCTVVANLEELKQHLTTAVDEYAVVLGPAVDLEAAAALADTLRVTRPATSVILIRRRVDTSVLAEALRSGMREVVEERDITGLAAAVKKAAEVWEALSGRKAEAPDGPAGKIITVFSPKGGVGKTTLSVNLAIALSQSGTKRVCLVDLDLAFGDVAITLQMFPARTMADVAALAHGLDTSVLETMLTPYRDNVFALVAPVQPDAKDSMPPRLIGRVLGLLKADFDFVVVDTAPSFDEFVLQAVDETDEMILVTTLDVPTLKNVKIATETLDLLNFPESRRHLVLNRGDDKVGLSVDKVESTLEMRISQVVPTSPQVANSTNSGEPIVGSLPRHPVSQAIASLARQLTIVSQEESAAAGQEMKSHPRRGLLRRNSR